MIVKSVPGRPPMYGRGTLLILAVLVSALVIGARASADTSIPTAQASATSGPQAPSTLGALINSGSLADLRWPNFSDVRADVAEFYAAGGNTPAWVDDGRPTAQARALVGLLKQASSRGLDPEDYDASKWDLRMARLAPATSHPADADVMRFDLALTICAARFLSALHVGRVNPQHVKFAITAPAKRYDLAQFLRGQVMASTEVDSVVAALEPRYDGYERARTALAAYLKLAAEGDGERISTPIKSVHPGESYPGIAALVARLRQLGDFSPGANAATETTVYQGAVVDGVRRFQRRHGLQPDGILGKETAAQLNVPLAERVKQLQYTLERYRWIPPEFPKPPILVNIPEFMLRTMRRQPAPFLSMRVVVGKAYGHQTPVFADYMRYLVFRPYWNVPRSIQFSELVPKIRRDRDYLAAHGFEVTTAGGGAVVTDGAISDEVLARLASGSLAIRQKPGPKNALGLVKFIFPNHYNVYLHSTPAPELFLKARRDFSHGCIRVQQPAELAAWVLRDQPQWTPERIDAAMNGDRTLQVNLGKPIPVLILYSTAVVEPDGDVRFFSDIYGLDAVLANALARGYPYPS